MYSSLTHGDSVASTSWSFRIGKSTTYQIIPEVCQAIWDTLKGTYLQCPQEEDKWINISNDFEKIWNFPFCIGAIDGKHCRIKAPANSGSAFHNYKRYFSLVLLAIADAHYRFILVDIGDYGSMNDAGIWSNTTMAEAFEKNTISIPEARTISNTDLTMPFCMVGDERFPLKKYLMRPYAKRSLISDEQRVFNYRLSRARRVIENAFGILVARWRILHTPLGMKVENAKKIIQATVCLHNFIMITSRNTYLRDGIADQILQNGEIIEGQFRNCMSENHCLQQLGRVGANTGSAAAMRQRDTLAKYFTSDQGSVPWQWEYI